MPRLVLRLLPDEKLTELCWGRRGGCHNKAMRPGGILEPGPPQRVLAVSDVFGASSGMIAAVGVGRNMYKASCRHI